MVMKNKIWVLILIAAMIVFAACGDDEKNNDDKNNGGTITPLPPPEPHGAPYDHLGIDEPRGADCGDNCTYKNYNTSTGENAFPKPIYRVGANADGYGDTQIQATANKIIGAYNNNTNGVIKMNAKDVEHFKAILTQPSQIVSGNGAYSLDGGTLKISVNGSADIVEFLKDKAIHEHLGINEAKCTASAGCELKDYRPAAAKAKPDPYDAIAIQQPGDYFPWPIYRVGALSNYPDNTLTSTVADILAVYKDGSKITTSDKTRLHNSALEQVHVTYSAPWDWCTWKDGNLGIFRGLDAVEIIEALKSIGYNTFDDIEPIVQLQPAGNIRMALNGALRSSVGSEQFPAVAARRKWVSVAWIA